MIPPRRNRRGMDSGIFSIVTTVTAALLVSIPAPAADWPQWRGPGRDGLCKETGLLETWPKEGPPLEWKATGLGKGYSSVSVAGGRILTMGNRGRDEYVIALDERDGGEVWAVRAGAVRADGGGYPGPRSTPAIDGDLVYALGINGDLLCLEAATGAERWRKDLRRDFGGRMPGWGYSESPLVDGRVLLCTPGGKEATIAALDKMTGMTVWKALVPRGDRGSPYGIKGGEADGAQYSSIIAAGSGRQKQYIQFLETGVAGISAADGTFLWRYNRPANGTANVATPIVHQEQVFAASGYGTGGGLVKLSGEGRGVRAEEVYFTGKMKNHHGGMVLVGQHLYGFDESILRCLEFSSGNVAWENRSVGKGSVLYADGHLIARSEGGPVALVEASPRAYVEKGRFQQTDRSGQNAWPHPVIANGRLYLRDQDVLLRYDLRAGGGSGSSSRAGSGGR